MKKLVIAVGMLLIPFVSQAESEQIESDIAPAVVKKVEPSTIIRPVHFPPVPVGWTMDVINNKVEYQSPINLKTNNSDTIIDFTYTIDTKGMDAKKYAESYVKEKECSKAKALGKGFYTTSCETLNTYAIFIGEVDNLYKIELHGDYASDASVLIKNYVNEIINGKHVFNDRTIGDAIDTN